MSSFLIPEMLAAQLGFTQGAASLEQVAARVTSLLEDARIATMIGEGHAGSLRAALGGGRVDEGQVIAALQALLAVKGEVDRTGLFRPRVELIEGWDGIVDTCFEEEQRRKDVKAVLRSLVRGLNQSRDRDAIRRAQLTGAIGRVVTDAARREALETGLVEFLDAFATELGLPPLEPMPMRRRTRREAERELPPAVQERMRTEIRRLLDRATPLVERLDRISRQDGYTLSLVDPQTADLVRGLRELAPSLTRLGNELAVTTGALLLEFRRRAAAYRVRVLRLFEQVLRQEALKSLFIADQVHTEASVSAPGELDFAVPEPTAQMADFLSLIGFDRGDPAMAEAAGVLGSTIFGWGEKSLPADLGVMVGALLYINEDLALQSRVEGGGSIRQVDPFDFLRLALGERGRAFFDAVQGEGQIVVRYPAYWGEGEFPYGEIGVPFALTSARSRLGATDADLRSGVDEVIAEVTIAGHRRGRIAYPQRMWGKTRQAFSRMFAVKGEGGEAFGEALLFFLTYLPYFNRWIPVYDEGGVQQNDADPRLTRWRIQFIPEDKEPAIGIDVGQRFVFSRPPLSYLAQGRIGRLLDETERRLLLYEQLATEGTPLLWGGEQRSPRESVGLVGGLRRRVEGALTRIALFQAEPQKRQPGDAKRMVALCEEAVRFAAAIREQGTTRTSFSWEGIVIDCLVVPETEFIASDQPAVREMAGGWQVRLSLDRHLEAARRHAMPFERIPGILRYEAIRAILRHRSMMVGAPHEDEGLAERLLPSRDERQEVLRVLRNMAELPAASGLTPEEDPWVASVLAQPERARGGRSLAGVPWADRLEEYARKRHAATDEEVALLREIVAAYLGRIGDPLNQVDTALLDEIIRNASKGKKGEIRSWLILKILRDFSQVAGWAQPTSVAPALAAAPSITPEGLANLALGQYLIAYRQTVPNQAPREVTLFLEPLARDLLQGLLRRFGVAFDEEELLGRLRGLLEDLNRREGRTEQPVSAEDWGLPQGTRWVLGPLADSPVARSLLLRLKLRLERGETVTSRVVEEEFARVAADRRQLLGEEIDPSTLSTLQEGFIGRLPTIRAYAQAAIRLARREAAPEDREIIRLLGFHYLFGGAPASFTDLAGPYLRRFDAVLGGQAIPLAALRTRRWLTEEATRLREEVKEFHAFLELLPGEIDSGSLAVDPEKDPKRHLEGWGMGLLSTCQFDGGWDETVAGLALRLGLVGEEGEIGRLLQAVASVEAKAAQRIEAAVQARATAPPVTPPAARPPVAPPPVRLPAPAWNPTEYAYLPTAQHAPFWTRVGELASREAPAFLLFYLTEEGARVARVSREDWGRAAGGAVRGSAVQPYPGMFRFTDQESGEVVELLPTQIRLTFEIDAGVRPVIAWLAGIGPADPSFVDIGLLEALAFYLPLDEAAGRDFQRLLVGFMQGRSQEISPLIEQRNRRNLREALNRYVGTHGANLARFRNFHANMGPWHFSKGVRDEIGRILLGERLLMSRFEKVVDMVEGDPLLGTEITGSLREAVRTLESKGERSEADYRELIDRFIRFYPEAVRRETERLARVFPADAEFQVLAEARELLALNSVDFRAFRHRIGRDLERIERGTDKRELPFFKLLVRVLDDPSLEAVHRPLQILLYPGLVPPYLLSSLISLVQARAQDLLKPRRREGAVREFLRFYLSHRSELLWRIKEREGTEDFEWAANVLPPVLPRKFALSEEFPEIEEITFGEIDECIAYLHQMVRADQGLQDAVVVNIDNRGLWRRAFLPADQVLFHEVSMGGRMTRVPLGVRVGDETLYFSTYLGELARQGILPDVSAGVNEIRVRDALDREVVIRDTQRVGRVHPLSQLREISRKKPGVMLEYLVLMEDRLRDLHPLLLMFYHAVNDRGPGDESFFGRVDAIAAECVRNPRLVGTQSDRIRRLLLEGYRELRPQFGAMGVRGRFSIHFDNPSPGR